MKNIKNISHALESLLNVAGRIFDLSETRKEKLIADVLENNKIGRNLNGYPYVKTPIMTWDRNYDHGDGTGHVLRMHESLIAKIVKKLIELCGAEHVSADLVRMWLAEMGKVNDSTGHSMYIHLSDGRCFDLERHSHGLSTQFDSKMMLEDVVANSIPLKLSILTWKKSWSLLVHANGLSAELREKFQYDCEELEAKYQAEFELFLIENLKIELRNGFAKRWDADTVETLKKDGVSSHVVTGVNRVVKNFFAKFGVTSSEFFVEIYDVREAYESSD